MPDVTPYLTCSLQTERQGHLFRCTLRRGHDEDHIWWLAAPVNTWIPLPVWNAETLTDDDWGDD